MPIGGPKSNSCSPRGCNTLFSAYTPSPSFPQTTSTRTNTTHNKREEVYHPRSPGQIPTHSSRQEVYHARSPIQPQLSHTTVGRRFSASADMLLRYTGGGSSSANRGTKKQLLQPPQPQNRAGPLSGMSEVSLADMVNAALGHGRATVIRPELLLLAQEVCVCVCG